MKPTKAVPMNPISAMDFIPLEQLHSLQLARLRDMVELAYANVPLFKARLDERGIFRIGQTHMHPLLCG